MRIRPPSLTILERDRWFFQTKVYEFSASHRLHSLELGDTENQRIFGKCNNPHGHGHNYVLEVTIKGKVNPKTGLVTNLGFLDRTIEEQIYTRFDFKHLKPRHV